MKSISKSTESKTPPLRTISSLISLDDARFLLLDDTSKSSEVPATITKKNFGISRVTTSFIGPMVPDSRKRCA
jgi:hypothetical protein